MDDPLLFLKKYLMDTPHFTDHWLFLVIIIIIIIFVTIPLTNSALTPVLCG